MKAETDALVYEITREDMERLLDKRPEIAERLTETIARYRLHDAEFMQHLPAEQQAVEVKILRPNLWTRCAVSSTSFIVRRCRRSRYPTFPRAIDTNDEAAKNEGHRRLRCLFIGWKGGETW